MTPIATSWIPSSMRKPDGVAMSAHSVKRSDELAEERAEGRQADDDEHEDASGGDEDEVDELRAGGRAATIDLQGSFEAEADRRHHPGCAPEQRDERDQPDRRERRRDLLDRLLDVVLCRLGDGKEGDELVDDRLAELVVLEHEPEDRDERDRQREEREEHAVGDRGRVLRAAVREHVLDRRRQRAHDAAHDAAEVLEGPPRESLERARGLGGGVAHPPECKEGPATGRAAAARSPRIGVAERIRSDRRPWPECAVAERNALARVVDSPAFTTIVVTTIAVNAAVLGLQTYEGIETAGVTCSSRSTASASGSSSSSSPSAWRRTGRVRSRSSATAGTSSTSS